MNSLHLHIGRIVVDGLAEREQQRFARVLSAHLDKFARSGIADRLSANQRKSISALPGTLPPGATAEQAAAQVVRSLRRSIAPNIVHGPRATQASPAIKPVASSPGAGEAHRHV
ncbi:MAG TPA: hypothetical protein VKB38_15230 [Terracidiphilus sp.]|nr:hypothetical protein [Terracidiphilus sp.]